MPFNRWECPWDRTWAYVVFKKHHTQLNDLWWSHHSASRRASSIAKSVGDKQPTVKAFPAAIFGTGRDQMPLSEWYKHYSEFDNWVRLSNAMALCGYFEVFLAKSANLALRSDPATLLNSSQAVDGVGLLKRGLLPDFKEQITSITKNNWSARLHSYEKYFGHVPNELASQESELDQLRKLRNGVGHAFGRDLDDYDSPFIFEPKALQRLSEKRLKKWLGIVEKAANAIDEHLREKHIGSFEIFEAYHAWDKKFNMGSKNEHGALRDLFPHRKNNGCNAQYFQNVIEYYKKS